MTTPLETKYQRVQKHTSNRTIGTSVISKPVTRWKQCVKLIETTWSEPSCKLHRHLWKQQDLRAGNMLHTTQNIEPSRPPRAETHCSQRSNHLEPIWLSHSVNNISNLSCQHYQHSWNTPQLSIVPTAWQRATNDISNVCSRYDQHATMETRYKRIERTGSTHTEACWQKLISPI